MIVAIDGPAGSGKSSTAKELATRLGLVYLDTGAMYRAVALLFIRTGVTPDDDNAARLLEEHTIRISYDNHKMRVMIDDEDVSSLIRSTSVTELSSRVSALPSVREQLVGEQRRTARAQVKLGSGVIMEGRDIGSVVFPDADIKFYLEAAPAERAERRAAQIRRSHGVANADDILTEIMARDTRDQSRSTSPLLRAKDAIVVDTTGLTFPAQVDLLEKMIRERVPNT